MHRPTIRTLTLGVAGAHPLPATRLAAAVATLHRVRQAFLDTGYAVQTIRLSTTSILEQAWESAAALDAYCARLQSDVDGLGIDHCSAGAAPADRADFDLSRLSQLPDLVAAYPALSWGVRLASAEHGVRAAAALPAARVMIGIAERTAHGIGNFRFAALARVGPGHPFFPASRHRGRAALTIGLQGAEVVDRAITARGRLDPDAVTAAVREHMTAAAGPVVDLGRRLSADLRLRFGGIDLSPAPSVEAGIGAALERAIGSRFGDPGTLAVVGAITRALRGTGLPVCGYNGVMLPVMEDPVLALAWSQGRIGAHDLLSYSAICGTGLDTVPLPGDTPVEWIAGLLLDVATLADRLDKPLSARLFPLPGLGPGDRTRFDSPYLVNLTLPGHG